MSNEKSANSTGYENRVVTDSLGRKIALKKPKRTDKYYLCSALGSEDSKNQACLSMMVPLLFVKSIDGVILTRPVNYIECIAALERLGDEGADAIDEVLREEFKMDQEEAIDSIKK